MEARMDLFSNPVAAKSLKYLVSAGKALGETTLPRKTQELVRLRGGQINGCGACVDIHTKEAAADGETAVRLHLVAVWREATVFTPAERAALALAEEGTRLADNTGVSDEVWANATKHYDEAQLGALVALIANINAFNRLNVITRQPGGEYRAGQYVV
ncbi:carboxymuconolactone decarboxylase family protein [Nocardia blacklockiae]|uniref:carboxymuconolactone decarboxylase family protein n=1 Tax=Nocardia blacklockiae TaxID=480036 RepID=UPI00189324FC|nr:carboxymuconolactone decarboxylase family protein [Nocardia blacklockiae]MBF6176526.1 carboxymuconolactone decarboxylase family protein [Nocardia blacklockiae]